MLISRHGGRNYLEIKMTRSALMTSAVTFIGLAVFGAYGHGQPVTAPPAVTINEQNGIDMRALAEQGEKLKAETEAALKNFDEMQTILESSANDARAARQNVEDMMNLLKAAADRLGPNGAYYKTLKKQEDFVRDLATEAMTSKSSGDHVYGEQLVSQAATIGSLRNEASDLAAKLTAQIDRLGRSKSQIAYAYAVKRTDDFINTARTYLDGARKLLRGATDLATKADQIVAPTTPTQ
jgi:vacuolar-type H+-ATPase subunit E/Vma4